MSMRVLALLGRFRPWVVGWRPGSLAHVAVCPMGMRDKSFERYCPLRVQAVLVERSIRIQEQQIFCPVLSFACAGCTD